MTDLLKDFIDYFKNEDWQTQDEILYKLFEVSVNWQCYAEEREAEKTERAELLANKEPPSWRENV